MPKAKRKAMGLEKRGTVIFIGSGPYVYFTSLIGVSFPWIGLQKALLAECHACWNYRPKNNNWRCWWVAGGGRGAGVVSLAANKSTPRKPIRRFSRLGLRARMSSPRCVHKVRYQVPCLAHSTPVHGSGAPRAYILENRMGRNRNLRSLRPGNSAT